MNKKSIASNLLLVAGILILINILAARFFVRLDFTADKRYSLSKATKDILAGLPETVTIKAYFTESLPADYMVSRRDFKELLQEYTAISKGNVVCEFINPNEKEETEREAMQAGIQPLVINVREKDQVKQQKAFMGALIQMGDQKEVIPFVKPDGSMEYMLSSSLKKLSVKEKPVIGLIQGHGEPSEKALGQAMDQLSVLYNVEPVKLSDSALNLSKYVTLALIGTNDTIPQEQFDILDKYLAAGGNLFIATDHVAGNFQTVTGDVLHTGIAQWLEKKGLKMENNFVIDAQCGAITVVQQQGGFNLQTQINFPYFPLVNNFSETPATKGLEQVMLPFACNMTWTDNPAYDYTPLLKSSKKSGLQPVPVHFDVNRQWREEDFPDHNLVLAAGLKAKAANAGSIVVIGNGSFATNGEGQQARKLNLDNVALMVNSIDYLSDETGLIDLRTKGITRRPLKQLEDSSKALIKWINFLLPIILVVIYGIYRSARRNAIKMRRMQPGNVD